MSAEERAFIEGFILGSEWQVMAHDPLLGCIARVVILLDLEGYEEVSSALDGRVQDALGEVKRARFNYQAAVETWELEKAATS